MPDTHRRRRDALRQLLLERQLPAALLTDLHSVCYLTGFTGSNAALLVQADPEGDGEGETVLATDGRYTSQAAEQVGDLEVVIARPCAAELAQRAARLAPDAEIGFESAVVTVDEMAALRDAAGASAWRGLDDAVTGLRRVKDSGEIELLATACGIADRALADLLAAGELRPGRTEQQVRADLEYRMLANGSEGPSFDTIVAAGPASAQPHHRPTDTPLRSGDLVVLDFGATAGGYHSDMTRSFVLGRAAQWQREIYQLVAAANTAGVEAVRDGAAGSDADAAARTIIADAGYGEYFPHGLGHGIGLDVHERPSLAAPSTDILRAGEPVTVEPGIYLPGRGGVRIEDSLVVREGRPELLTHSPTEFVELDN